MIIRKLDRPIKDSNAIQRLCTINSAIAQSDSSDDSDSQTDEDTSMDTTDTEDSTGLVNLTISRLSINNQFLLMNARLHHLKDRLRLSIYDQFIS
jgi:hypothetical protein